MIANKHHGKKARAYHRLVCQCWFDCNKRRHYRVALTGTFKRPHPMTFVERYWD